MPEETPRGDASPRSAPSAAPPLPSLVEVEIVTEELDAGDLDAYPFGIIKLDSRGRILAYNLYEEALARLRREDVIGRSFFFDVAPCTRVRAFYGRYLRGVEQGAMDVTFGFLFPLPHGDRAVEVRLLRRADDEVSWVIVRDCGERALSERGGAGEGEGAGEGAGG